MIYLKAFFKFIRVITVAPVIAAATVTLLYFFGNGIFKDTFHYFAALLTLTFFPLLAYPLSLIKPSETRRGFQRSAAIVFSVAGYIAGLVFSLVSGAPAGEKTVYFTYLLSGIIIALSSFVFKYKSSGHTCGIAGPVALLVYYINPVYAFGFLLLLPVSQASVKMKRHTPSQLVTGSVIPVICMFISLSLFKG